MIWQRPDIQGTCLIFMAQELRGFMFYEELDLPYSYWIPKMHKDPHKHRFIAGASKCSTKLLSILLTNLLTHIKHGLRSTARQPTQGVGSIRCGSSKILNNYYFRSS